MGGKTSTKMQCLYKKKKYENPTLKNPIKFETNLTDLADLESEHLSVKIREKLIYNS